MPKPIRIITANRIEWLAARMNYLTASNVASVLEIKGAFANPKKVFEEKTGQRPPDNLDSIEQIQSGNYAEDGIVKWFGDRFSHRLRVVPNKALYTNPDHPWLAATADALVYEMAETYQDGKFVQAEEMGCLEVKNAAAIKLKMNRSKQPIYDKEGKIQWIDKWADGPPLHYVCQHRVQQCVLDVSFGWISAAQGGQKLLPKEGREDISLYRLKRDMAWEKNMLIRTHQFWTDVLDYRETHPNWNHT